MRGAQETLGFDSPSHMKGLQAHAVHAVQAAQQAALPRDAFLFFPVKTRYILANAAKRSPKRIVALLCRIKLKLN